MDEAKRIGVSKKTLRKTIDLLHLELGTIRTEPSITSISGGAMASAPRAAKVPPQKKKQEPPKPNPVKQSPAYKALESARLEIIEAGEQTEEAKLKLRDLEAKMKSLRGHPNAQPRGVSSDDSASTSSPQNGVPNEQTKLLKLVGPKLVESIKAQNQKALQLGISRQTIYLKLVSLLDAFENEHGFPMYESDMLMSFSNYNKLVNAVCNGLFKGQMQMYVNRLVEYRNEYLVAEKHRQENGNQVPY